MRLVGREKNDHDLTAKATNILVDHYITTISFFGRLTKPSQLLTFHELISWLNDDAPLNM